jgi:hypothetical protein
MQLRDSTVQSHAITATTNQYGVMTGLAAPVTGVFKGSFRAWFDYGAVHTYRFISYEGVLTPEREDAFDGVAGRGFFLSGDKSSYRDAQNRVVSYPFNWSYDFLLFEQ